VVGDRDDRGSRVHGRERHQLLAAFGAGPVVHGGGGEAFSERADELGDYPAEVFLYGQHLMAEYGDEYYARAQRARKLVTAGVDDALDGVDVLAGPTTPMVAPAWDSGNYLEDSTLDEAVRTTGPFNLTGHPAVSVPCGSEDGLQLDSSSSVAAVATPTPCVQLPSGKRWTSSVRPASKRSEGKAIADFGPPTGSFNGFCSACGLTGTPEQPLRRTAQPRWIGEVDELQHDFVDTELRVRL